MENRISGLFGISVPIVQAGMIWCSGWKLAAAVSNAGGLGIIGAGSMYPDTLREHIVKFKKSSDKPFAVNVPLLYPETEKIISVLLEEGVKIVFTSAGNPSSWTSVLKSKGLTIVHVVSSVRYALKAENAGVDAVVAEGFEAGGHNGREETTTICLVPRVSQALSIPVIAAGGIASGQTMLAAFALGAEGVQVGSRFAASIESSAHTNFKKSVMEAGEGDTILTMKKLAPVRLIKNDFYYKIMEAENSGASPEELKKILGQRRAKQGIFEGDLNSGELEIGQISADISKIQPAKEILEEIWNGFIQCRKMINDLPE
jgi:enoyl-[acyl-carrier protein] reductase II